MSQHYDVVIIGSGAGGATFAQALADTGKSILILERGQPLPVEDDNWSSQAVFIDKKYRTTDMWLDRNDKPFRPATNYWVGGNTSFYGAALMRMKPRDFELLRHCGGGISPAWPISYAEMAPWYTEAEKRWQVHGERGVDPFDDPNAPPFPFPALTHDPSVEALRKHFVDIGWHPSPLPLGIRRNDADPGSAPCIRCTTCGGYPCKVKAKVDARTAALATLEDKPNVTLLSGRKVLRLETDATGKTVTAVVCEGPDGPETYSGDIVAVAAGAANSAALLLASANAAHPNGLANGSDQVGRNYMFHMTSAVVSLCCEPFVSQFPKTLTVMDFYFGEPDGSYPYPMGQIQLLEYMTGETLQGQIADMIPPWLLPDAFMNALAHRMVSFLAMSEDLPSPANRVTLARDGQIKLSYTNGDTTAHERLVQRLDRGLDGFAEHKLPLLEHRFEVDQLLPLYGTAHQCGTLRFGIDPNASVVDSWCKAHELDNLYVVDSSFFASSSAVNPTLTIVANALRVGAHVAERLG
jgi:choline dehydrogenase-like flavoprotein